MITPPPEETSVIYLRKNPPPLPGYFGIDSLPYGGFDISKLQLSGPLFPPYPP